MTHNKLFLFAAAAVTLFTACENTPEREPSPAFPDVEDVYFLNEDESASEVTPNLGYYEHDIIVARRNSSGELTVNIYVTENTDSIFNVPASVTFHDQETTATLTISFEDPIEGETYALALHIDSDLKNPYTEGFPTYVYDVTPITYIPYTGGVYVDDILAGDFIGYREVWYVDYEIATLPNGNKKVRVLNPYYVLPTTDEPDEYGIWPEFPWNEASDLLEPGRYHLVVNVDGTTNEATLGGTFNLGIDWGFGPTYVVDNIEDDEGNIVTEYGEYIDGKGVFCYKEAKGLKYGDDEGLWDYAGFSLYFSLEAYLEDITEPVNATVDTYTGEFLLTGYNYDEEEDAVYPVTIKSDEDEEGQYYIISGIPGASDIYGYFDERTHYLQIGANYADPYQYAGVEYESYFLPMNATNTLSFSKTISLIPDGQGGMMLADNSWGIGYALYVENPDDEDDFDYLGGLVDIAFVPATANATAAAPYKVASGKVTPILRKSRFTGAYPRAKASKAPKQGKGRKMVLFRKGKH